MTGAAPDTTRALPDDADALRALLLAAPRHRPSATPPCGTDRCAMAERDGLAAERDALAEERDALAARNERLGHLLLRLKRLQFGAKSECLPGEQLQLGLEDTEAALARGEAVAERRDPVLREERAAKRRASRGALPAHLPRVEVTLAPEDAACPCCRGEMAVIGHDTSERLDVIPARFRVVVTRRPKLACRACAGVVVQAPAPPRLIEGGLPTEATVAHVLVSRYADHLPLYRQARIMARQGVEVDRSTLASWVGSAAAEVAPVVARLREIVLASERVFADETTLPVLDPGRGRTKTGYLWAVARDDRAWGGADPPAVVYAYAPGRGQEHADRLLGGYRGILQCDGYATYKRLAGGARGGGPPTLVFCWAHVRRGFYDLAKSGTAPVAAEALERIAALYGIEAEARGRPPQDRRAVRQERSRPLVQDSRAWFDLQLARLPGRGPTAGAIRYALNHWDGLVRFLDDGRIEPDTNAVERAIRPVKSSRKNALFAGGDEGGANWAHLASLVETCKLNGVDPQVYLSELLTRLVNGWPQARIDGLMPWCWATPKSG